MKLHMSATRPNLVGFRVSDAEQAALDRAAARYRMSKSELVRQAAAHGLRRMALVVQVPPALAVEAAAADPETAAPKNGGS